MWSAQRQELREGKGKGETLSLWILPYMSPSLPQASPVTRTTRFSCMVKMFRVAFYTDCETRLVSVAKIKGRECVINGTKSINKPKCMGSRIQAGELALCRKGHVLEIMGRGVDADKAYQCHKFREAPGSTDSAVEIRVYKLSSASHLRSCFSLFHSRKRFRIQAKNFTYNSFENTI